MKEPDDWTSRSAHLTIHTRRTLAGNGTVDVSRTVHCSRRDKHVPFEDCLLCDEGAGIGEERDGRRYVGCNSEAAPSERPSTSWRERHRGISPTTPVSEVMTPNVLCIRDDVPVEIIAALLLERGISAVPVVNAAGKPLGIVSKTDLVREAHENHADLTHPRKLPHGFHVEAPGETLAREVMTPLVFSLPADAPIGKAAALMSYERVHRTPVLSPEGRIVGLISASDVLRWVARESGFAVDRDVRDE